MDPSNHTLATAFAYYLQVADVGAATKERYAVTQAKCQAVGMLDMQLTDLTPAVVRAFLNALNRELETRTVWLTYQQLMTVITTFTSDHQLPAIKINGLMRVPRRKDDEERLEDRFTVDDIQTILKLQFRTEGPNKRDTRKAASTKRVRDLWVLMCFTGMAIGDLLTYDGKIADGFITYRRGKNGQLATVPVFPISESIISNYTWPLTKLPYRTFHHHCTLISKILGRHLTPHTARHSCGCILLDLGLTMEAVSKILGHANPLITASIYAKTSREKIAAETAAITSAAREKIDALTHLTQS